MTLNDLGNSEKVILRQKIKLYFIEQVLNVTTFSYL